MLKRFGIKILSYLLKSSELSDEDRSLLTTLVLDNLHALPIRDIISVNDDGSVVVNGRTLTPEQVLAYKESARGALNNSALKLIHEQVNYVAVSQGIHKANSSKDLLFSQSAIWYGQQEIKKLESLANIF